MRTQTVVRWKRIGPPELSRLMDCHLARYAEGAVTSASAVERK